MKTLSGEHGLYTITGHAAARIAQRFGVEGKAEQSLWVISQMGQATQLYCEMLAPFTNALRILWCCADGTRLVTDGNEVITAWMQGEADTGEEEGEISA